VAKLKIDALEDDKPVRLTIELPAHVHRNLRCYSDAIRQQGQKQVEVAQLIATMLAHFMASDREFKRLKRSASLRQSAEPGSETA
jgi:hypothetical protein